MPVKTKSFRRDVLDLAAEFMNTSLEEILREDYSGRGMYGATCFGVVLGASELAQFGAHLASAAYERAIDDDREMEYDPEWLDEVHQLLAAGVTDSMARDVILYFPGWVLD